MHSSTNAPSQIDILSGPFGSEAAKLGTSTREIFAQEKLDVALRIHDAFRRAGTTTGVTSTFAAAPRGLEEKPFDWEFSEWNKHAVHVTRKVYGNDVMASLAPALDTSGGNDNDVPTLPADWFLRRHEGQATALRSHGIKRVLGEAFRYVREAREAARLLEDLGFEEFVCSFEARHPSGRHPHQPDLTYEQVRNEIVSATRGKIDVGVGVNCASVQDCRRVLEQEPDGVIRAAYPNKAKIGTDAAARRFVELAERGNKRTALERKEFENLRLQVEHSQEELLGLLRICLEKRVGYVGVCCGGTPEDIAFLSKMVQNVAPAHFPSLT